MAKILNDAQFEQWRRCGAVWPVDLLSAEEADALRARYEALDESTEGGAQARYRIKAHLPFPWLWEVIRRPRLIAAIEDLLGPDFVCWGSSFFAKKAHDPSFISWHQDSTYYGLEPPESVTAWIAFTDATSEAGCMKIVAGSHLGPEILVHDEIPDPDNMLVRGQTVREVDESLALEMPLAAGQMSIHHNKTIHSSEPNRRAGRASASRSISRRPACARFSSTAPPRSCCGARTGKATGCPTPSPGRNSTPPASPPSTWPGRVTRRRCGRSDSARAGRATPRGGGGRTGPGDRRRSARTASRCRYRPFRSRRRRRGSCARSARAR